MKRNYTLQIVIFNLLFSIQLYAQNSWSHVPNFPQPNSTGFYSTDGMAKDDQFLYVMSSEKQLAKSSDGINWVTSSPSITGFFYVFEAFESNGTELFLYDRLSHSIFKSTDNQ